MGKRKRNSKKVEKLLKKLRQELVDSTSDSSTFNVVPAVQQTATTGCFVIFRRDCSYNYDQPSLQILATPEMLPVLRHFGTTLEGTPHDISEDAWKASECSGQYYSAEYIVTEFFFILHRILSFLIIVTLCSTSSVMFHGLSNYLEYRNTNLTSNITLMLPIWYPFNESKHLGLAFTLDLCLLTIGTLTNFTTQALFLTLTTHVAFQLKSLQIFAEDLELCYEITTIPHQTGEENYILTSLKWLYRRHYRVIEKPHF
ncbi:uncharacterized protein LOC126741133 isoform X2 [Anthonomus grandis grandis]|uniref:uncharacterized protein LOC126741133 isoform X2 n=1 Tax=Anthonomus grandis grandis TaxID=2921223 RepID=UPI002164F513|nr:uncharacterized protein LOC126741133 isoform X2 [Anthonomus grandis grandis]